MISASTDRLEGKLETQAFYDLADKYGILVMGLVLLRYLGALERVG